MPCQGALKQHEADKIALGKYLKELEDKVCGSSRCLRYRLSKTVCMYTGVSRFFAVTPELLGE